MSPEEPGEKDIPSQVAVLAERWHRILSEASPEPLPEAARQRLHRLAERAIRMIALDQSTFEPARQLGEALYQLVDQPVDVAVEIQTAWLTEASRTLAEPALADNLPRLSRLAGALALGFWSAQSRAKCTLNQKTLRRIRHDLKTPLNSITGFSKVILNGIDGPINDFQREDLTTIFESGQRLLGMIDDVMGTLEQDAAKPVSAAEAVDVAALIGNVVKTAQPWLAGEGHQLIISFDGQEALGEIDAACSQVRWILLAVLFTFKNLAQKGRMVLNIRRAPSTDPTSLMIQCTCTGLAPEVDAGIVEKAPQFASAQQLCTQLGGELQVKVADPGECGVNIYLPVKNAET